MMEHKPRSVSRFGIAIVVIFTVLFGTLGGGILGGIAGYVIALNQPTASLTIPEPSNVSVSTADMIDAPALTPSEGANPAVVTENEALIAAVEAVKPATVTILNYNSAGGGSGSGVIIDQAGYIVTNYHVVQGARRLEVIFAHGGDVSAQLIGGSPEFDLAVLKVDAAQVPAVATFGDSAELKQGERVAAIGSALGGFRNTVTSGVVSAHNRILGNQRGLLQTDTAINHGNSGGPLVNLAGEIVGINVMVLRGNISGDVTEGLGFSIPSNTAKIVAKQLIETGEVQIPYLGVGYSDLNPQLSMENQLSVVSGSLIEEVLPGTAAATVGLRSGDVILTVNGKQVDDAHPLSQLLLLHNVGEEITLTIVRGSDRLDVEVRLGSR
jgi:2-alkenal reductase